MCSAKLQTFLRNKWIELQFANLDVTYTIRFRLITRNYKVRINHLQRKNYHNQIKDLLVCINYQLHFISPLLSEYIIRKINRCKQKYYRHANLKKMIKLADIVYNCDIEDIEKEILAFIK